MNIIIIKVKEFDNLKLFVLGEGRVKIMREVSALKISVDKKEIDNINIAVKEILNSDINWTNSKYVRACENEFSQLTGISYCTMTSTGSSAIEAALISLNIEDTVIFVPVLTAPATIYSCLNSHSQLVMVDANPLDYSLDIEDLEDKIKRYYIGKCNKRGAVIVVHVGGIISSNMDKLRDLTDKYGLYLIEDCAHAHGSVLDGKSAGSWGKVATYSFFLTKTITAGEGGAVLSYDLNLIDRIRQIINYGKDNNGKHIFKGSSWRMNEFSAAVLLNQIKSYNPSIRRSKVALYNMLLSKIDEFTPLYLPEKCRSGYYKYIVKVQQDFNYNQFKDFMKNNGVTLPAKVFDRITVKEPYFENNSSIINRKDHFPNAQMITESHICLPIYESLSDSEVEYICNCMTNYSLNN